MPRSIDTECHFLFQCSTFILKRQCFIGKLSSLGVTIEDFWPDSIKLAKVLCPTSTQAAKCTNKFISILEKSRKLLDEGTPVNFLGYRNTVVVDGGYDPDVSDCSLTLSSINSDSLDSSFEE